VPTFHDIDVVDERLRTFLGDRLTVNSLHHQAIAAVGTSLRVAAVAPDGLIEAVISDDGLILGVQWHPEQLALGTVAGDAPFAWLRSRLLEVSRALPYPPK
jgi:putative glutamine amidotransferase